MSTTAVATDGLLMARAFAGVYLGGATASLAWVALAAPTIDVLPPILCSLAAYVVAGLALLPAAARAPVWVFELVLIAATGLITLGTVASGADAAAPTAALYFWATPYAFWFLSLGRAVGQVAFAAAAYALVQALTMPTGDALAARAAVARWILAFATLVALGALVRLLAEALRRERLRSEEEIRGRALRDPLTGLPNRALFLQRLEAAVADRRASGRVAVLYLDLDNFKGLNDSAGHAAGDELLVGLAPRLVAATRPGDVVARFGGDEFVILLRVEDEAGAVATGRRVLAALDAPLEVAGEPLHVTTSVGIAVARDARDTAETLVRDADAAMYRAKGRGRGGVAVFDEAMRQRVSERVRIERELRGAVDRGELRLAYQPIVALDSGEVRSLEALVRWQHPERGLIAPGAFIPIAEATNLILPIGRWVLEQACRDAVAWNAGRPGPPVPVNVNLSARQVVQPDVASTVADVLAATGAAPALVALEISETVLLEEDSSPGARLAELRALGVRVVLDDFGSGYSSLGYLTRFPLDALKLDRSFAARLGEAREAAPVVRAVVQMGRALGLDVVAEGVEDEAQLRLLRATGCSLAQGFLFARPLPVGELPELLAARRATRRAA